CSRSSRPTASTPRRPRHPLPQPPSAPPQSLAPCGPSYPRSPGFGKAARMVWVATALRRCDMYDLQEIEAIKRLKYRYVRFLDHKRCDELAALFTEDAEASYSSGKYAFSGRDQIMEFLRGALGSHDALTSHRVHEPEIDVTGPTTARGIWGLDDVVIYPKADVSVRGAAFYEDEYVKIDGEWNIRSTGYRRLYEEFSSRKGAPSAKLT